MTETAATPFSTRTMNLAHLVEQQARRLPDAPAFIWGDEQWSWRAFDRRVKAMAAALAHEGGIRKGDRVLVQSQNCNQLFESMFACFRLGAVWVPANFRGMPDDLVWMAELSGAKALICNAAFPEHAAIEGPSLETCIAIGKADFGPDINALMERYADHVPPLAAVDRDDPAWLFFTSGTSGRPKASVLTHGQLGFVINNHLCDLVPGSTEADASLVVAPLSHGAGMHQLMMAARGAPTILPAAARFDTAEIWSLVERWRVTNMFTVPTILKMLVEAPEAMSADHSSLRHVIYAGAPMYRSDQIKALDVLGPVLVQYFGLGEVTGAITFLPPRDHSTGDDMREGTCGYARTGMQVEIQGEDGTALAPGETGEICVTGGGVFAGYWRNPEANAKSFRDGWFRTGDIGHMDENGYVYITGRASDMYISGGSNIYPREIEEKILLHPAVTETAVFGMPDPKWGEIGVAVCVLEDGHTLDGVALDTYLRELLSSYKLPRQYFFWEDLPKTGYGKLSKRIIRAELEERLAAGESAP
ncbi:acyl-CoA synthetase [Nisaea sp.]|uniref:acyl-CoA synthetase n=2 Tax=Nisaea sp. TaxID=2024842 RepID=UPI0032986938